MNSLAHLSIPRAPLAGEALLVGQIPTLRYVLLVAVAMRAIRQVHVYIYAVGGEANLTQAATQCVWLEEGQSGLDVGYPVMTPGRRGRFSRGLWLSHVLEALDCT